MNTRRQVGLSSETREQASWMQQCMLALASGGLFFLVYLPLNAWSSLYSFILGGLPHLYLEWETRIPFVAEMIVPYMSLDLFFVLSFFLLKEKSMLYQHAKRIGLAIFISAALFILYPLEFGFYRPLVSGWEATWYHVLSLDLPYNQFPSLHISLSVLIWPIIRNVSRWKRNLLALWFVAIGLSTLLTYQHHFIDLLGGLLVGGLVMYLLPLKTEQSIAVKQQSKRMAYRYLGVASLAMLVAIWLRGGWLLLLYPALSCLLVASAYYNGKVQMLHKQQGSYCFVTWLLFTPYLLATYLNWVWHKPRLPAYAKFSQQVYFGRKLTSKEAYNIKQSGVTAVLDLAPELKETTELMDLNYLHIPMLDLQAPGEQQLEQALKFIIEEQKKGVVFIHCALGMSRSLVVLLKYVRATGKDYSAILGEIKSVYPHIYLPAYQLNALN